MFDNLHKYLACATAVCFVLTLCTGWLKARKNG